jgi:sugar/nucleoside kinase (ribokinase family)
MDAKTLKYDPNNLRYVGIIGTGGIGSGKLFMLNGDHTLGREESRSGHFLVFNDYCKQHIILHYIKVLLGRLFIVIPVGKIGDDDIGQILYNEMHETGFVMNRIERVPQTSTLFSFCFCYPDGSGGNMTTDNSASAYVDADFIEKAGADMAKLGPKGIIMTAPEVPLVARQRMLELGKKHGLFCTASFTSEEVCNALDSSLMENIDLLTINIDEASAVARLDAEQADAVSIVQTAIQKLQFPNERIMVAITAGKHGSWCWDGHHLNGFPAVRAKAISTAGAGDAFFSGILCGLALGLCLFDAQQLASLVAGLSVTSPHTINKEVDRHSLNTFIHTSDLAFSDTIIKLLED